MKVPTSGNPDELLGYAIAQKEIVEIEPTQKAVELLSRIFNEGGGY
jgi:hypothetical protein